MRVFPLGLLSLLLACSTEGPGGFDDADDPEVDGSGSSGDAVGEESEGTTGTTEGDGVSAEDESGSSGGADSDEDDGSGDPGSGESEGTEGSGTGDGGGDDQDSGGSAEGGEDVTDTEGGSETAEDSGLTEGSGEADSGDTGTSTDDPDPCDNVPPADPSWITTMQEDLLSKLTGEESLPTSDVTLSDRATVGNRNAARDYLLAQWEDLGIPAELHTYGTGANVVAELVGDVDSTRTFVLGAHFDSVSSSPGANDNATGVALVIAVARHLQEVPCRAAHVRFVLFDQEEVGLVGSEEYAADLADEAIEVPSVHTVDQMGWDMDGDRAVEVERPDMGLLELYEGVAADLATGISLLETNTGSTDHVSFCAEGFDAVGLTEEYVNGDTTPHYHQSTDLYGTVNFEYLRSTTVLVNAVFTQLVTD